MIKFFERMRLAIRASTQPTSALIASDNSGKTSAAKRQNAAATIEKPVWIKYTTHAGINTNDEKESAIAYSPIIRANKIVHVGRGIAKSRSLSFASNSFDFAINAHTINAIATDMVATSAKYACESPFCENAAQSSQER